MILRTFRPCRTIYWFHPWRKLKIITEKITFLNIKDNWPDLNEHSPVATGRFVESLRTILALYFLPGLSLSSYRKMFGFNSTFWESPALLLISRNCENPDNPKRKNFLHQWRQLKLVFTYEFALEDS